MRFVVDTSSVQGIRGLLYEALSVRHQFEVSPITVYELLCHVDEMSWQRARGNLHKIARSFSVRHDPFAEMALRAGVASKINQSRLEDRELAPVLLQALASSNSLAEFYATEIRDRTGATRTTMDVAKLAREALAAEEEKFSRDVRRALLSAEQTYSAKGYENVSAMDLVGEVWVGARSLSERFGDDPASKRAWTIFESTFLHIAYRAARALKYLIGARDGGLASKDIVVDANDTEDSYICLHVALSDDVTLVCDDRGTVDALEWALAAGREFFASQGMDCPIRARVWCGEDFKRAMAREAADIVAYWQFAGEQAAGAQQWNAEAHWLEATRRLGLTWHI